MAAPFTFTLPEELSAKEPPERRGLARDQVRLLVLDRATGKATHARFDRLGGFLKPGDLLVFNSSRTLPASLQGRCASRGLCIEARLAEHLPDDSWLALLRCRRGDPFGSVLRAGLIIDFGNGLAGVVGYPGWGAYGISKFGLEGLSQTWAAELAESQVRVNWVDPGSMNTAMHRAAEPEEDPSQWAEPAEVTEVFVFLASDKSKGVTGTRLQAQGDWKQQVQSLAADAQASNA